MTDTAPGPRIIELAGGPATNNGPAAGPCVVETNDARPIEFVEPQPVSIDRSPPSQPSQRFGPGSVALGGMTVLIGGFLSIGAANWITAEFERNIFSRSLSAAIIAAGVGGVGYWLTTEIKSLKRLRVVEAHQIGPEEIGGLSTSQAEERIAEIVEAFRAVGVEQAVAAFRDALQPYHSSAQRLELLSRIVLRPLDKRAETAIRRAVVATMGISAVVPTALGDSLIFGIRGLQLMRKVAEIYGHRPGAAAMLHLIKRLLLGTGAVGAADFVGNTVGGLVAQHLSGAVMEKVGENIGTVAAESVSAGQRMARIGIFAMRACRPVAFGGDEEPSITKLVLG